MKESKKITIDVERSIQELSQFAKMSDFIVAQEVHENPKENEVIYLDSNAVHVKEYYGQLG